MKLNSANIAKAKPGDVLRDDDVKGLALRVFPSRSVYYLRYRTRNGRERRPKIGDAATITLPMARAKAKEWLGIVAAGGDPALAFEKAAGKTIGDLRQRFMESHVATKVKPGTARIYESIWENHAQPKLGRHTEVANVTRADVSDLHHAMRATPPMANRTVTMLHKAFDLCESWGWRPEGSNPVKVELYPERKRRRVPSINEAIALLKAMDAMRAEQPYFIALIELLCFTGCRRMEVQAAKRAWITPAGLELPDAKRGARTVPLNEHARGVVDRLPVMLGNPYLIAGKRGAYMHDHARLWKELCNRAAIVAGRAHDGLCMHDLRRYFASAGLSAGLTLEAVGQLLGHASYQTTKGYAFLLTDASALLSDRAGDAVKRRMAGA